MKALLTRDFSIAPEGHTVFHFKMNDQVTGKTAEIALANNAAIEISDIVPLEKKVQIATETKSRRSKSSENSTKDKI